MNGCWSWADVWPGTRVVTLVLDAETAAAFLDRAAREGRLVAADVVKGLPDGGSGERPAGTPLEAASQAGKAPAGAPSAEVIILPCVRREPLPEPARPRRDRTGTGAAEFRPAVGSILAERPPARAAEAKGPSRRFNKATGKWMTPGTVSAADRQLVAEAIAAGRITKCPPRTFSEPAGATEAWVDWHRATGKRGARAARTKHPGKGPG